MKPLVVDTSIWIDWLRGLRNDLKEESKGRVLFFPAVVALELFSGANTKKSFQVITRLVETFERNRRIILPTFEDYKKAGEVLSDLNWPASKKANDTLILVGARKIGAEVWTCDYSDFAPIAANLHVSLKKMD